MVKSFVILSWWGQSEWNYSNDSCLVLAVMSSSPLSSFRGGGHRHLLHQLDLLPLLQRLQLFSFYQVHLLARNQYPALRLNQERLVRLENLLLLLLLFNHQLLLDLLLLLLLLHVFLQMWWQGQGPETIHFPQRTNRILLFSPQTDLFLFFFAPVSTLPSACMEAMCRRTLPIVTNCLLQMAQRKFFCL